MPMRPVSKMLSIEFEAVVADAVGKQQVAIVQHAHEARRIAARRDVSAVRTMRSDHHERRTRDHGAAVLVETAEHLTGRTRHRGRMTRAHIVDGRHIADRRRSKATFVWAFMPPLPRLRAPSAAAA